MTQRRLAIGTPQRNGLRRVAYRVTGFDQWQQPVSETVWLAIHWRKAKRLARKGVEVRL